MRERRSDAVTLLTSNASPRFGDQPQEFVSSPAPALFAPNPVEWPQKLTAPTGPPPSPVSPSSKVRQNSLVKCCILRGAQLILFERAVH